MYFLLAIMILGMLIFAANFSYLLIGGLPGTHQEKEFEPVTVHHHKLSNERISIGTITGTFGLMWLAVWIYFVANNWNVLDALTLQGTVHLVLELAAALSLILASVAVLRSFPKWRGYYYASMVILTGNIVHSIYGFNPQTSAQAQFHQSGMKWSLYFLSGWTFFVVVVFTLGLMGRNRMHQRRYGKPHEPMVAHKHGASTTIFR